MSNTEPIVSYEEAEKVLLERGRHNQVFQAQHAEGHISPIQLARLLGIRNQMVYNYIRKGKIDATYQGPAIKMVIVWHDAVTFAQGYLDRAAVKKSKIDIQLKGE